MILAISAVGCSGGDAGRWQAPADRQRRWEVFAELLSSPQLPSGLKPK